MEKRQKILIAAVAVLGVVGVATKGRTWFFARMDKLDNDLRKAKDDYKKYSAKVDMKGQLEERYRTLASKTFAEGNTVDDRVEDAGKNLKALLLEVAQKSKIGRPTINKALDQTTGRRSGARLSVVKVNVSGQGAAKDIITFLGEFYKLPYLVRIRQLSLTPHYTRTGEAQLKMGADIEALVLPDGPAARVAKIDEKPRPEANRLERKSIEAYAMIWEKNPFQPIVPPPPDPKKPDGKMDRPTRRGAKPRGEILVVGVTRYPWQDPKTGQEYLVQEVLTRNTADKAKQLHRVGDSLGEGSVVYVDSYGAVVRKPNKEYYFYPLGKALKDGERLDPQSHPEQYRAVQQLDNK
ncbi:MAG: hypothetical protein JXQ73_17530 [Phycisphaerae bacterium]|nr:hypothetical protein [Phycisphaerae bacterium]